MEALVIITSIVFPVIALVVIGYFSFRFKNERKYDHETISVMRELLSSKEKIISKLRQLANI